MPGLLELAHTAVPAHLVICGKDRVFPAPRSHRYYQAQLPAGTRITELDGVGHIPMLPHGTRITELDGVGHIPMFEAPERVTESHHQHFLDEHSTPLRAVEDPPAS